MTIRKKESPQRSAYIERVKYLLSTSYTELNSDDKINLILIKIILEVDEYYLLQRWYINKWKVETLSTEFDKSNVYIKGEISKIITKLKPYVWSYKNSPFIKDTDIKHIEKNTWIGDLVLADFIKGDSIITTANEYLHTFSDM